ncbi:MAG: sensor histidine kinase [Acidimicrobiia bacterium]
MERSVNQGLAAFRWCAWLWMAAVLLISHDDLRPGRGVPVAVLLVGTALAVTVVDTVLLRTRPEALLGPGPVLAEVAVAFALVLADGFVYGPDHAFSTSQSLGSVWPLAGILAAGAVLGPGAGGGVGVALGLARVGATLINGADIDETGEFLSLTNTTVFYAVGGAVAGYLARLLRRAERQVSAARAREEVARTLHDGVLQTLAVVERRATDPALARLAREQERELREYLFGAPEGGGPAGDLGAALREAAARFEDSYGARATVLVADDVPVLRRRVVEALAGAVGEALTNAGKHGRAERVTVYVEPDGRGVFCSVKDDGAGFDVGGTPEGVGLSRSIRGRVGEVGGRVELRSQAGSGTEVLLWVP